jgi:hypothetical protein
MENIHSAAHPAAGQSTRFAQVELSIIRDKRLTDTDVRILSAFLAHRNAQHGKAWPKRKTIAGIVGCHVESVSRSTKRLESCGWLAKVADGRGRGHTTVYTFPLADQRQARRREAQAKQPTPTPRKAKDRKPRAERKPNPPVAFCGATPYRGTDSVETENLPQTPPCALAPVEPEGPRCEFLVEPLDLGPQGPDLGPPVAEASAPQREARPSEAEASFQPTEPSHEAAPEAHRDAKAVKPSQPPRLAFHEALPALVCVQLGRMLSSSPEAVAQEMLDEMAWNARHHVINNPAGYLRRLLNLHLRGEFSPETAHFERQRRERIEANAHALALAEQRHLEALRLGQLPATPPIVVNRSAQDEAMALAALAQAKLAARGALLSHEQREAARLAYAASKGTVPVAPIPAPQPQGDDPQALEFFQAMKARLKTH